NLVHPGLGSVVVSQKEARGELPAYITISGLAPKAGYLGQRCEAYFVSQPGEKDPYLSFPERITEVRGNRRLEILQRMNRMPSARVPVTETQASAEAVDDAIKLMRSPALEAFEVQREKPEVIERYGDNNFGRGALLARRLVEKGVRFVQI